MTTEVRLPHIGENIAKATVLSVRVALGQVVALGDPVVEIETDKASLEVPAEAAGVVREVRVREGDGIAPDDVLVVLDEGAPSEAPTSPEPTPMPPAHQPPVAAAPLARRFAREVGIDIRHVAGSSPGGVIGIEDVKAHARRLRLGTAGAAPLPPTAGSAPPSAFTRRPEEDDAGKSGVDLRSARGPQAEKLPDFALWGPVRRVPFTRTRATIARRLEAAWQTTPLAHHFDEADVTELEAARLAHNTALPGGDRHITITAIVLKHTALLLGDYPELNASLDIARGEVVYKDYCHIGVAVDTARGLVVPVIRDCDRKPLADLAAELRGLAFAARQGNPFVLPPPGASAGTPHPRPAGLLPDELHGSSFTISNLGRIGGTQFAPILNPTNVAILGVSRMQRRVALTADGRVAERLMLPLVLGYDHRLIDGAQAARFLRDLAAKLAERPDLT